MYVLYTVRDRDRDRVYFYALCAVRDRALQIFTPQQRVGHCTSQFAIRDSRGAVVAALWQRNSAMGSGSGSGSGSGVG